MDKIPFPSSYKQALLSGEKTMTIRVKEEVGKYQGGEVYRASSYEGEDWRVRIKIVQVTPTEVGKLAESGIPQSEVEALLKRENVSLNTSVELIRFRKI